MKIKKKSYVGYITNGWDKDTNCNTYYYKNKLIKYLNFLPLEKTMMIFSTKYNCKKVRITIEEMK